MITADDFTIAEEGKMPAEAGSYILLLRSSEGEIFFTEAMYSPKSNPNFFTVSLSTHIKIKVRYEVIAWAEIQSAHAILEQLTKGI